jgi:hypothetical protein
MRDATPSLKTRVNYVGESFGEKLSRKNRIGTAPDLLVASERLYIDYGTSLSDSVKLLLMALPPRLTQRGLPPAVLTRQSSPPPQLGGPKGRGDLRGETAVPGLVSAFARGSRPVLYRPVRAVLHRCSTQHLHDQTRFTGSSLHRFTDSSSPAGSRSCQGRAAARRRRRPVSTG